MGECVAALKLMKLLPPDYTLRDPRRLPMFVSKPDNVIVGRVNELESVHRGLLQQKRLVVIGGPGEGKTALARSVTRQLYNEGCFPAGAFEVDMTGASTAIVAATDHTIAGFIDVLKDVSSKFVCKNLISTLHS